MGITIREQKGAGWRVRPERAHRHPPSGSPPAAAVVTDKAGVIPVHAPDRVR